MPINADLTALRVAVTGGTSGLGLALVRLLAARGARVAFVARTAPTVELIAKETGACGIVGDVGRKEDIYPLALQITGNLGGLDALINNASSLGPTPLALLADTRCEELEQALAVNLMGPFRLTKALFGALAASATGRAGRRRDQHFERRRRQPLLRVGRVRGKQGCARPPDGDLGGGGEGRRRLVPFARSWRHGYAAPCAGRSKRRSGDLEAARGRRP